MPSSICKCDKPLEPLSIYPTYSNSFYPLHLFLSFIHTQTFPFTNILHPYLLNTQLIFSQSFSLSRFFSLFSPTFSPTFNLFLYLFLSLSLCLSSSLYPRLLCLLLFYPPLPLAFPSIFASVFSLGLCISPLSVISLSPSSSLFLFS